MNSAILFILSILATVSIVLILVFRTPKKIIAYFKTEGGQGALKGIIIFTLVGVIVALSSLVKADDNWFEFSEVFIGIDNTVTTSPQCDNDGPNDHLTSNGGFRQNVYISDDEQFFSNLKYTHHSCAINPDQRGYDAIGLELIYRFNW